MRTSIAIAIALMSATAAHGQTATRTVVSGQTMRIGFYNTTNPDCTAVGRTTIRLTYPPEHGRATITQTTGFPSFPQSNVRSACNTRRVAGTAINYTSQRGFVGTDNLQVEVIFASGTSRQVSYTLNVR